MLRIECRSIDDFVANLRAREIVDSTVYVDRSCRPLGEVSTEVTFQASALAKTADGTELLVECGEACGVDRDEADSCNEGTESFGRAYDRLVAFCESVGLAIRPGLLGF